MYSGGYGGSGMMGGCYGGSSMMGGGYGGSSMMGGGYGGMGGMSGMGMRSNSMMGGMSGMGMRNQGGMYGGGLSGGGSMYGQQDSYDQTGYGNNNGGGLPQQNNNARRGGMTPQQRGRGGAQQRQSNTTVSRTNVAPNSGNAIKTSDTISAPPTGGGSSSSSLPAGLNQTPMTSAAGSGATTFGAATEGSFETDGGVDWSGENQDGQQQQGGGGQQFQQQGNQGQQTMDDQGQMVTMQQPQMTEEEHKMQRRTFFLQSMMELSQIFSQVLQPFAQFLSLGFGSYMGIASIRQAWNGGQPGAGGAAGEFLAGQPTPALPGSSNQGGSTALVRGATATGDLTLKSKIALGILTALLFMLVERIYQKYFGTEAQLAAEQRRRQQGMQQTPLPQQQQQQQQQKAIKGRKHLYVARHSFNANAEGQLSFKVGDRFMVESYDSKCFVSAELIDPLDLADTDKRSEGPSTNGQVAVGGSAGLKKGLIPGNYIEPLSLRQKF